MPLLLIMLPLAALALYFLYENTTAHPGDDGSADSLGADMAPAAALLESLGAAVKSVGKLFTPPASAAPYAERIAQAEQRYGLPASLLTRVLYQESRFRTDVITGAVRSSAGALGIAQFMPATARDLAIDPLNPNQAIDGAARYLRRLYDQTGSWDKALAAYNWGIGNVQRKGLSSAPAETRAYVRDILNDVQV